MSCNNFVGKKNEKGRKNQKGHTMKGGWQQLNVNPEGSQLGFSMSK